MDSVFKPTAHTLSQTHLAGFQTRLGG